jgi:uncharacterized protein involved in exopolysaccharide biosynthesis
MPEERMVASKVSSGPSPTLRDVLAVIFRHQRLVACSFLGIVAAALLYGFFFPSYRSHMTFLVRHRRVDPIVSSVPNTPEFVRQEVTEEELNSEVEILRDESMLAKVAAASGLMSQNSFWPWDARPEIQKGRAVRAMLSHLSVQPVRKTTLISVTYDSKDPDVSARVLDSLARTYLQKHEAVHRPTGEFRFFDEQTNQYRQSLQQAEQRLLDFSDDAGIVSGVMERDMALQKASEIDAAYRQGRIAISETEKRIESLQAKLAGTPERTTTQVRVLDNPELMGKLKSKLLELELKRTELLTQFEPGHRFVQEVDQQLAETKAAIGTEESAPLRDETTEPDANHEWAKAELAKAQVELAALQSRNAGMARLLTDSHKEAGRLGSDALRQQDLLREMKEAEETYLLYVRKREEARIADALDERGIINVTIAEPPTVPVLPLRSVWTIGLVGMALAATISFGLAFAADFLDPCFRTPAEVAEFLDTPVLASLARESA